MRRDGRTNKKSEKSAGLPPMGKIAFLCLFLSLVVCNYLSFGFGMMLPTLPERMISAKSAGLLSSVPFFTLLLFQLPASAAAVRMRPKLSMGFSFLCLAGGCLCHALAADVWALILGRMLLALHVCSLGGAVQMLKGEWIPQERILDINSAQEFSSNLGHVMGTLFAPLTLALFVTWRRASGFCTLATAGIAALWWCFYRDRADWAANPPGSSSRYFALALCRRTVRLLILGWPGTTAIWVAFNSFWPSYALSHTSLDYTAVGLALGMVPVGSAAASLLASPLTRRINRDKIMICAWGLVLPLFYLATLHTENPLLLCALFFFAGFSAFAFVPVAMSQLWKLPDVSAPLAAAGTSLILLSANLGSALVGVLYGFLAVRFSQQSALAICCVFPLLWFFSTLFLPAPEKDAP